MREPGFADLDRRTFLATAGRAGFWGLVALAACPRAAAAAQALGDPRTPTPGFPVAATESERTVAAILETVLPGRATDPDGGPGALEAGALNLVHDSFYPVRDFLPAAVALIEAQARQQHGAAFADLDREARETLLAAVQGSLPFLRHAWRFVRGVFFADLHDGTGGHWLGFPGPNLGYRDHPEFSLRQAVCEELTSDGNLP